MKLHPFWVRSTLMSGTHSQGAFHIASWASYCAILKLSYMGRRARVVVLGDDLGVVRVVRGVHIASRVPCCAILKLSYMGRRARGVLGFYLGVVPGFDLSVLHRANSQVDTDTMPRLGVRAPGVRHRWVRKSGSSASSGKSLVSSGDTQRAHKCMALSLL